MVGDKGFDPLGFANSIEKLRIYREAELKHGRLAMLAALGWPVAEELNGPLAKAFGMKSLLIASPVAVVAGNSMAAETLSRNPSLLNGGLGAISPIYWASVFAISAAIELYATKIQKRAGFCATLAALGAEDLSGCLSVRLFVRQSVCLSACLPVCLSVFQSFSQSVCFSFCLSVCLSAGLSGYLCFFPSLSVSQSVCLCPTVVVFLSLLLCPSVPLSVRPSVCLSVFVCLSVCQAVCLSVHLSVGPSVLLSSCLSCQAECLSVCLFLSVYL